MFVYFVLIKFIYFLILLSVYPLLLNLFINYVFCLLKNKDPLQEAKQTTIKKRGRWGGPLEWPFKFVSMSSVCACMARSPCSTTDTVPRPGTRANDWPICWVTLPCYTTLHYTTLHYTTLHYTTLHYTALHYTTLHN